MKSLATEAMGKGAWSPVETCLPVRRSSSVKLTSAPLAWASEIALRAAASSLAVVSGTAGAASGPGAAGGPAVFVRGVTTTAWGTPSGPATRRVTGREWSAGWFISCPAAAPMSNPAEAAEAATASVDGRRRMVLSSGRWQRTRCC